MRSESSEGLQRLEYVQWPARERKNYLAGDFGPRLGRPDEAFDAGTLREAHPEAYGRAVGVHGVGRVADSTVFCRAVTSCSMDHQLLQIYRYWFRGSVKMEPIPVGELGSIVRYLGSLYF